MVKGKMVRTGAALFLALISQVANALPNLDCSCTAPESFGLGYSIELSAPGSNTFKGACSSVPMKAGTQFVSTGGSNKPKACVDPSAPNGTWATFPAACRNAIGASTVEGSGMEGGCGFAGTGIYDHDAGWKKFSNTMCCDTYYLPPGAGCTADKCKREGIDYNTECDHLWSNTTFSTIATGNDVNFDGYDDAVVANGFCNNAANYTGSFGRSSCHPINTCNNPTPTPSPSPSPTPTPSPTPIPTPSPTPTAIPSVCNHMDNCHVCPIGHVCKWDSMNSCCIDQTNLTCLANFTHCTAPSPTPTPSPTPVAPPSNGCTETSSAAGAVGQCSWAFGPTISCTRATPTGGTCQSQRPSCPSPINAGTYTSFSCYYPNGGPTPTPSPSPGGGSTGGASSGSSAGGGSGSVPVWNPPCVIGAGGCAESYTKHGCDSNSYSDYNSKINRKLACCMNAGSKASPTERRLDCLETKSTDFDTLWTSKDLDHDGGQMNAVLLAAAGAKTEVQASGKVVRVGSVISGFYSREGVLCPQYSEFMAPGGTLTRYKVEAMQKTIQQEHVASTDGIVQIGNPYPSLQLPVSISASFHTNGKRNKFPTTIQEMNLCPVLVRAAIITQCPQGSKPDADGNIRCEVARSVSIRVKIEQLFEIAGTPSFKPIDTVLNPEQASFFNVKDVLSKPKE